MLVTNHLGGFLEPCAQNRHGTPRFIAMIAPREHAGSDWNHTADVMLSTGRLGAIACPDKSLWTPAGITPEVLISQLLVFLAMAGQCASAVPNSCTRELQHAITRGTDNAAVEVD